MQTDSQHVYERRIGTMKKTIVVIDDDPVTLKLLERTLINQGHTVFTAENGNQGLELVSSKKPDILISDMLLPGIHGVEICRKIKESEELSHIKVVMMTSVYKDATYLLSDMECRRDGFLKKPIDLTELETTIKDL
jgi:DNA-binding response OmpR family regulator